MKTLTVDGADLAWNGGDPVLTAVTVAARPGEILAVTGTSGAGKSTLLSAMAGLLRPVGGEVRVEDERLRDRDHAVRLGVVLIPQDNGLAAILTAAENISVAVIATGGTPAQARRRTAEALDPLGLSGQANQLIEELSGGQQRDRPRACPARRRPAGRRGHQ